MKRMTQYLFAITFGGATLGASVQARAQDAEIIYTAIRTTHHYTTGEELDTLQALFDGGELLCSEPIDAMTLKDSSNVCGLPERQSNVGYHTDISFGVCGPETYEFRVGADWGNGGAIFLDGSMIGSTIDDLWWNANWGATSEVLYSTSMVLGTGVHAFDAFGFENCCDGVTSVQFRVNGGAWQDASVAAMSLADGDHDNVGDTCDVCPYDPANDADADGLCADVDNCPLDANTDQLDTDGDGDGDACDDDDDADGVLDGTDNCPLVPNADQLDWDGDFVGDACDTDDDGDGVLDGYDLCLNTEPGAHVGADGCSVDDLCPCESSWKNHGAYVSCVAHVSESLVDAYVITEEEKDVIVSEAAKSSCGVKR